MFSGPSIISEEVAPIQTLLFPCLDTKASFVGGVKSSIAFCSTQSCRLSLSLKAVCNPPNLGVDGPELIGKLCHLPFQQHKFVVFLGRAGATYVLSWIPQNGAVFLQVSRQNHELRELPAQKTTPTNRPPGTWAHKGAGQWGTGRGGAKMELGMSKNRILRRNPRPSLAS